MNERNPLSEGWTETYADPAMIISVSMIRDRKLTPAEKAKLKQLEIRVSRMFSEVGVAIRVCEGFGEGDQRKVGFIPGLIGPPLVSFPASHFLSASNEELLHEMQIRIEEMSKDI